MTTTNDLLLWPGRNTYTVDLSTLTAANGGLETECIPSVGCPTTPWTTRSVRFFRIDPHESTLNVKFRLAGVSLVRLTKWRWATRSTSSTSFADADPVGSGSSYTAKIYADGDRIPGGMVLLGTQPGVIPGATQSLTFNPSAFTGSLSPGEYFIYVEITENRPAGQGPAITQVQGGYSGGVLRIFSANASKPEMSISNPTSGSVQPTPFSVTGCAYDAGDTTAINVDDLAAFAIAGSNVTGPQAGTTQVLGFGNTAGDLAFLPVTGTPVVCPSVSDPASPIRNSGFAINNISGLSPGNWTLRVMSRSTLSGQFFTLPEVPFSIVNTTGAPGNFTASAAGNIVTISFTAPTTGPAVGSYVVDGALNPTFTPASFNVIVPAAGTYSGHLGNGVYYLRVVSLAPGGARGAASAVQQVTVGPAPATPPGAPVLSAPSLSGSNVTLNWAAGPGGAPASYTIVGGFDARRQQHRHLPDGRGDQHQRPGRQRRLLRAGHRRQLGRVGDLERDYVHDWADFAARRAGVEPGRRQRAERHPHLVHAERGAGVLYDPGPLPVGRPDHRDAAGQRQHHHGRGAAGHLPGHDSRHQQPGVEHRVEPDHGRRPLTHRFPGGARITPRASSARRHEEARHPRAS